MKYNCSYYSGNERFLISVRTTIYRQIGHCHDMVSRTRSEMKVDICPPCGCSLARLGISKKEDVVYSHKGEEYRFCCDGCLDIFKTNPKKYLQEISNLVVCPTCLKEKPKQWTSKIEHKGTTFYFCRCPHCEEAFKERPNFYIKILAR